MHLRLSLALLSLLLGVGCVGGGSSPGSSQPEPPAQVDESDAITAPDEGGGTADTQPSESDDSGTVTARPEAEIEGRCERQPRATDTGEELVADLRVVNTGNLGIVVRVSSRWPLDADGGVLRWSRVRVPEGKSKPLTIALPVDTTVADSVRAAVEAGRKCRVRSSVTGAFGVPGEE